jgi:hypothetical protein
MGARPLLSLLLSVTVLFASALTGTAAAAAANMDHGVAMMEMGHCSSPPASHGDGKSTPKPCCTAMCMAVAVAPAAPAVLPHVPQAAAIFTLPRTYHGFVAEIATPPPRLA